MSIIIPTYNRPEMLHAALLSAINQTYKDLEILVCDDGASAEVRDMVARLRDPRVAYSANVLRKGMLRDIVDALESASGQFVTTLHDDDLIASDAIEQLLAPLLADSEFALSFCDAFIMNVDGEVDEARTEDNTVSWGRSRIRPGRISSPLLQAMAVRYIPANLGTLFRKTAVDWTDFPEEVASVYDYWLVYLALRDGCPIYYLPRRLTYYRSHGGSETALGAERVSALSSTSSTDS